MDFFSAGLHFPTFRVTIGGPSGDGLQVSHLVAFHQTDFPVATQRVQQLVNERRATCG